MLGEIFKTYGPRRTLRVRFASYCWVLWELDVPVKLLAQCGEIAVRLGMGNERNSLVTPIPWVVAFVALLPRLELILEIALDIAFLPKHKGAPRLLLLTPWYRCLEAETQTTVVRNHI